MVSYGTGLGYSGKVVIEKVHTDENAADMLIKSIFSEKTSQSHFMLEVGRCVLRGCRDGPQEVAWFYPGWNCIDRGWFEMTCQGGDCCNWLIIARSIQDNGHIDPVHFLLEAKPGQFGGRNIDPKHVVYMPDQFIILLYFMLQVLIGRFQFYLYKTRSETLERERECFSSQERALL